MLKPRKRLVKAKLKEDKLLIFTARVQSWAMKYQRHLLYGAGAIVVIVALGVAYGMSKSSANKNAAYEVFLAWDAFNRAEYDQAATHAKTVMDDYPGTSSASAAMMLQARVHEQRGEYDEAMKLYREVIDANDDSYLTFGAYSAAGAIYYGKGEYTEAAKNYEAAADNYPQHFSAAAALLDAGKSLKKVGKFDAAKKVLRRALSDYPKSRVLGEVRTELEELEFEP